MVLTPWLVRFMARFSFACITDANDVTATRFSSQLKGAFGINVSQIELLGSMTVGILNEVVAKSRTTESDLGSATALDDGSAKYGEPLVPILNDRLVYDEPYTTDASPHQYRIWLAQVNYPPLPVRVPCSLPPARI